MNRHIVPSIVASVVSCGAALGFLHFAEPKYRVTVENAQAAHVSPAKALLATKTVWPELEQAQIDALTAKLGTMNKVPVTILCLNEARCGNLALNLENAFESAHWTEVVSIRSPIVPSGGRILDGIWSSSSDVTRALNAVAPNLDVKLDEDQTVGRIQYIAIGERP